MDIVGGAGAERVVSLLSEVFKGTLEAVGGLIGMSAPGKEPTELHHVGAGEFAKVEREEIAILDLPAEGSNPVHLALGVPLDGAVALAGFLLMKSPEMITKRLGAAALDDTEQDAFGEVCNILAGSIETVLKSKLDNGLKLRHGTAPRYRKPSEDPFLSHAIFYAVGQVRLGELPPNWLYLAIDDASARRLAEPDELPSYEVAPPAGASELDGAGAAPAHHHRPKALWYGPRLPAPAIDPLAADVELVACDHPDEVARHARAKPPPQLVLVNVTGGSRSPRQVIRPIAEHADSAGIPVLAILERPTRTSVIQAVQAGAGSIVALASADTELATRVGRLIEPHAARAA